MKAVSLAIGQLVDTMRQLLPRQRTPVGILGQRRTHLTPKPLAPLQKLRLQIGLNTPLLMTHRATARSPHARGAATSPAPHQDSTTWSNGKYRPPADGSRSAGTPADSR